MNSSETEYAKYLLFPNKLENEHVRNRIKEKRIDLHREDREFNIAAEQDAFKRKSNKIIEGTLKEDQMASKYEQTGKMESRL